MAWFELNTLRGTIRRAIGRDGLWWIGSMALVLAVSAFLSWAYWDVLHGDEDSVSTTVRNIGLVVGGIEAILVAIWRSVVSGRQADTAEGTLLNERYQKGAEMLGDETLAVRLAGIYALRRLAIEHPVDYHVQVMELLCAFVRNPIKIYASEFDGQADAYESVLEADVQAAMRTIACRDPVNIRLEPVDEHLLYLRGARLAHLQILGAQLARAWLTGADLSETRLPGANLSRARLRQADLSGARLTNADLSGAVFWGADLSGTVLRGANLSGTDFAGESANSDAFGVPALGLTQGQIDSARADPDNPPKLLGVLDARTSAQLVWLGQTTSELT